MEMTRQRKILIAVVGVGAAALIADRLFLGAGGASAPSVAQASRPSSTQPTGSSAPRSMPPTGDTVAGGSARSSGRARMPLLHRMQQLPEAAQFDQIANLDAFKPPEAWLPEVPEVIVEDVPPDPDTRAERFEALHRLTAVMSGPTGDLAVIGGRTVRLGESLDGFTLIAVDSRSAIFRADDLEVVLTLPEPSVTRPRRR